MDPLSLHLLKAVADLSMARDLEAVMGVVKRAARALTGADGATFVLRDGDLCRYADEDAIGPLWKGRRFAMSACISGWAMLHREAVALEDVYADPRIPADAYRPTFVKSLAMVPIRVEDPIGAIGVYWGRTRATPPQELEVLQALAGTTACAIENVRLCDQRRDATAAAEKRASELAVLYERAQQEIRHREQVEEQLRQGQKMEAIGRLAGGIAHDFNNLLMVINGYGERLADELAAGSDPRNDVEEIRKAGRRAASLVQQLLAFARRQVLAPTVLDLNAVVQETLGLLRRLIPEHIDIVTRLDPTVGPVRADASQLTQVLMNLGANARDAMPARGTLSLKTRALTLSPDDASRRSDLKPGPHVVLEVGDTGTGIDAAALPHLFEPFFTTKGQAGTGLGLSTVYGIVKQCGGDIAVDSQVGRGTTFRLFFPRAEGPATTTTRSRAATKTSGTETILVVEDEASIRKLLETVLVSKGYRVLVASDPYNAVELAERHRGELHLLLTDVVMPGMNGPAVAQQVRAARPNVRVLFMSGYPKQEILDLQLPDADAHFLTKPVGVEELARRVREVLDAPRP